MGHRLVSMAWLALYAGVALVPYGLGVASVDVAYRNVFTEAVTVASMAGMMLMLLQFALSGRVPPAVSWVGVDRSLRVHRRVGEWLAIAFLVHPVLIVLPRFWVSGRFAPDDLWATFTAPLTLTGFLAWSILLVWVAMAMFRDRLGMGYEAWRISHGAGAAAIAMLATDHVTTVGRHGYHPADRWLDGVWIAACAAALLGLLHNYLLRPWLQQRRRFRVVSVQRASRTDWCLTIEQESGAPLPFAAGQFVWLNTSASAFARAEHPFSIASSPASWPRMSFIIRSLGTYTSHLDRLRAGKRVHVDGPHGEFTLRGRDGDGIGLIATGAGIGPVLGLLRQLRDEGDARPIRLVYGNRTVDQAVCQTEILELEHRLDFRQVLAVTRPDAGFSGHVGRIDADLLRRVFATPRPERWDYFVCGSAPVVRSVVEALRDMRVPGRRIVHESLAF